MKAWMAVALAAALMAGSAKGADRRKLETLQAPPPADIRSLPIGAPIRAIRIARVVVQLKPEPWALIRDLNNARPGRLVTWSSGEQEVKTSVVSGIFNEEIAKAGGKPSGSSEDLFSQDPGTDLLLGVKVGEMAGNLCQYCNSFLGPMLNAKWHGIVTMSAHWEIYSTLDRSVVATIDTSGGFASPRDGLDGEPDRLINEAFRDNVRRLISSEAFRRVVTTPIAGSHLATPPRDPITLRSAAQAHGVSDDSKSVAVVFAGDGSGSGFVISDDGYLLTNQHVVVGSKYVKLKWSDGKESLGEVIRTDARRDVALVKADAGGRPALALRSGPVQQGETVFVIGSPLGEQYQNTMSKGIVSALRTEQGQSYIQSDAMVNHGSSGGPLLDEKGRVIGLTDLGHIENGQPVGLNFFIPIDDALRVLGLTAPAAPVVQQAATTPPAGATKKH
jgi:serine protease Do